MFFSHPSRFSSLESTRIFGHLCEDGEVNLIWSGCMASGFWIIRWLASAGHPLSDGQTETPQCSSNHSYSQRDTAAPAPATAVSSSGSP